MRRGWGLGWLAGLALSWLAPAPWAQENRLWFAAVELEGPLESVDFRIEGAGGTRLGVRLDAGQRRALELALPARAASFVSSGGPAVAIQVQGAGSAQLTHWSTEQPEARRARLARGVRTHSLPAAAARLPAIPAAALVLLAGCALVALMSRRRPAALGLLAASAVLVVVLAPAVRRPAADAPSVLEGEGSAPEWALVRSTRGSFELLGDAAEWIALFTEPAGASLQLECEVGSEGVRRVRAASDPDSSALLTHVRRWAALRAFERASGGTWPLSECWTRSASAGWLARGPWPAGAPLPEAHADRAAPPGWLAAGLPQGPEVLLGEFEGEGPGGARFLRLVGVALEAPR